MVLHNAIQYLSFIAKRLSGHNVALRRNDEGALVLRTGYGHARDAGGFVLRASRTRKKRFKVLIAASVALSLLLVAGMVAMDQAVAARSAKTASGAAAAASNATIWNVDFSSDVLFMAGVPVFAILAVAQVLLLIQIREGMKN